MLYNKVKQFVNRQGYLQGKTFKELNDMVMSSDGFQDILAIYIKLVALNKDSLDKVTVESPEIEGGRYITKRFDKQEFIKVILSKGQSLLNSDKVVTYTLYQLLEYTEKYMESYLLMDEPQYLFFSDFQAGRYEGIEFVFNINTVTETKLLEYTIDGEIKTILDDAAMKSLTKNDILAIYAENYISDKVKAKLKRVEQGLVINGIFPKWKKFVLEAAKKGYQGIDLSGNGGYMKDLTDLVNEVMDKEKVIKKDEVIREKIEEYKEYNNKVKGIVKKVKDKKNK